MAEGALVVEHKDVMLAVLGAGAAMSALILVFLGFLISAVQSYRAETSSKVLSPYRVAAGGVVWAFLNGVLSITAALWWLIGKQASSMYGLSIVTFFVQLAFLVLIAAWVFWKLILGK